MRVLVACEESQEVCKAFRELGHEAYSCDLITCSGGYPEWHLQCDALQIIKITWDLIIAHPPCTYLSNAGARWLYKGGKLNEERYKQGLDGKEFFMRFYNANCSHIAIENPIPSRLFELPPYTQIIQPFEYGEPWSKKTCLWLKGLPPFALHKLLKNINRFAVRGVIAKIMILNIKEQVEKVAAQNQEVKLSRVLLKLWLNNGAKFFENKVLDTI